MSCVSKTQCRGKLQTLQMYIFLEIACNPSLENSNVMMILRFLTLEGMYKCLNKIMANKVEFKSKAPYKRGHLAWPNFESKGL
jgi:hypothetical protein